MEVNTPEQCASAYAITNYYHADVIEKISVMINEASDESELDIAGGLLRGSLQHLLDKAQLRIQSASDQVGSNPRALSNDY